jgi:hypothetical protein
VCQTTLSDGTSCYVKSAGRSIFEGYMKTCYNSYACPNIDAAVPVAHPPNIALFVALGALAVAAAALQLAATD